MAVLLDQYFFIKNNMLTPDKKGYPHNIFLAEHKNCTPIYFCGEITKIPILSWLSNAPYLEL